MKKEIRKANTQYRRAAIRASKSGRAVEEYRRLRTQREMTKAVLAILEESETK